LSSNAKIEVTVNVFSSCNYGVEAGTTLGTTSEGTGTAVVSTINAVVKKLNGGFLCPETTKFAAAYVSTAPSNTTQYVSSS
jgi:alcohol dehydrogenase class IV